MLTLIGDTTLVVKNPKVGNLETVDTGVTLNASRRGVIGGAIVSPTIKKRRFDFQCLTLQEKEDLITWLLQHIGRAVTVQWTSGGSCNVQTINEQYIIDDQPLETITVRDADDYDCMTYWIKV
jgi:hypothetical protein